MAQYTYVTTARTVEEVGDFSNIITRIAIEDHPITARLSRRAVHDPNPKAVEDTLSSIDTSNAHAEDADAPAASDTARTLNQNYCQILMKTAEVSDTQNSVLQHGMGEELLYQEMKKQIEIMKDYEAFVVSDQAAAAATTTNSRIAKMAGMTALITTNTDATGDFSQANYNTLIAAVASEGGKPNVAYMDATRKAAVDAWTTTPTRFTTAIQTLEKEVLRYHSSIGQMVDMYWHPYMPQDIATAGAVFLLLDLSLWELVELLPLTRKILPDNGAGPSTLYKWQPSLLTHAEKGNAYFGGT